MKAMVLDQVVNPIKEPGFLRKTEMPDAMPGPNQVRIEVTCCGVCHTELDEIEGRTPPTMWPAILGHQVVGRVRQCGSEVKHLKAGDRVGVAWIFDSCGHCVYCRSGLDNLCPEFKATGRDAHGGYAESMVIPESSAFFIPESFSDEQAAPLLCAGAIGYRSLRLANLSNGLPIGLTGFGASGHLMMKMILHQFPNSKVFVFARNPREREFALELGAAWAGPTEVMAPQPLAAIIDTTPVWKPVLEGLRNLAPGGRLVINAIRKEDVDKALLAELNYGEHLWMEKEIKSVANVARRDVHEFLALADELRIRPNVQTFPLEDAEHALLELKHQKIRGAKVLVMR